MQSGAAILSLLIWSSAVISAPAGESPTPELSLGDRLYEKQEECEGIISEEIDAILDDEDSNPLEEIPIPDDNYHDCKEDLDKLKREYMTANNIDKSTNTEFFTVEISEGISKSISVPAEEGAEIRDLEFDVKEELCVTNEKCTNLLELIKQEKDTDKGKRYNEKFAHCHILLDFINHKYVQEKKLDEAKMKVEGGYSVKCTNKPIQLSPPQYMNNLDYNTSPQELFGDMFKGDLSHLPAEETTEAPAEDHQDRHDHTAEEDKHGELAVPGEGTSTRVKVKGSSSKAAIGKPHIFPCVLVIFVLVTVI